MMPSRDPVSDGLRALAKQWEESDAKQAVAAYGHEPWTDPVLRIAALEAELARVREELAKWKSRGSQGTIAKWRQDSQELARVKAERDAAVASGTLPDIETVSSKVHQAWIDTKLAQGITSRPSADGIEQMVPYAELPDALKELDRATVRVVYAAIDAARREGV